MDERQNSIVAQTSVKAATALVSAWVAAGKETPKGVVLDIALELEDWIHRADTRWPGQAPKEGEMFRPAQNQAPAPHCEKCGSEMWDNRKDKKNPKGPDFKCKDKNCAHAVWLTPFRPEAGSAPVDSTPPF
jgi:hypothetical protein